MDLAFDITKQIMMAQVKKLLLTYSSWMVLGGETIHKIDTKNRKNSPSKIKKIEEFNLVIKSAQEFNEKLNVEKAINVFQDKGFESELVNVEESEESNLNHESPSREKKSAFLLKRGDGPRDYSWREHYFLLEGNILSYYKSMDDKAPIGQVKIEGA